MVFPRIGMGEMTHICACVPGKPTPDLSSCSGAFWRDCSVLGFRAVTLGDAECWNCFVRRRSEGTCFARRDLSFTPAAGRAVMACFLPTTLKRRKSI